MSSVSEERPTSFYLQLHYGHETFAKSGVRNKIETVKKTLFADQMTDNTLETRLIQALHA